MPRATRLIQGEAMNEKLFLKLEKTYRALSEMGTKRFSDVSKDGRCPKCGYAVMKNANPVTSNLAVGTVAALATGGLLGPTRKKIRCGGCGARYLLG